MAEYTKKQINSLKQEHDDWMDRIEQRKDKWKYFTLDFWKKTGTYELFDEAMSEDIKTILDVGCHIGFLDILYSEWGEEERKVTAIDISSRGLECAKKYAREYNKDIKFRLGMFETMKFKEKYDLIILSHVIEHTYNPKKMIDKAIDLCNKKLMIVAPIYKEQDDPTHKHWWYDWNELFKIIDWNRVKDIRVRAGENDYQQKQFYLILEKIKKIGDEK